ncbi:uracil-DNA glycosylase [Planctomicrobium sp. SH664]|uniref:uracil-DNA glycosylase n=1 Tax=Planctomicrobium sp. SH664 TaxID=3448125 RepID=UPI003F5BBFE5
MSNPQRAARQMLNDLRAAGLTHLPRAPRRPAPPVAGTASLLSEAPPEDMPKKKTEPLPPAAKSPQPVNLVRNTASPAVRTKKLKELAGCVADCVRCPELARTRTQTVFGVGNPTARVMFIGEAPGADEDRTGEPFVGRAGQLLTKIIEACGWQRSDLYICNILRCRPPENRTPSETEAANCREYLDGQISIVDPDYIVCWGTCAAQNLLASVEPIGKMRGRFFQHGRAKVLCTYHPSYLLRNPAAKKPVWEDMKLLLNEMGLKPPVS